jgi:hypothetical protein
MTEAFVRKLALVALLVASAAGVFAFTVSVSPSEGVTYVPPPDGTGSPLDFFVSGCMDALFESGCVVTDSAPERLSRSSWESKVPSLAEAKEGLVDYVICLYVEWNASTYHKDVLLPASIAYRILRVSDGAVLANGELEGIPDSEEASQNFEKSASRAGRAAVAPFISMLSTQVMGGKR